MILWRILRTLEQIEERLGTLHPLPGAAPSPQKEGVVGAANSADEWIQAGIDNILSYQAGKKEEKE